MSVLLFRQIAESRWFNNLILWVIVAAGILVGIQTYSEQVRPWHDALEMIDLVILFIFTLEFLVKMIAEGNRPWRYFRDPWNAGLRTCCRRLMPVL
jgi:voltage-gated sodium channel